MTPVPGWPSAGESHCSVVSLLRMSSPGNQFELHWTKNTSLCWGKVGLQMGVSHQWLLWMVRVFNLQMSLLWTNDWEMPCVPFDYFHRQYSLWEGCPCVIPDRAVTLRPIVLIFHGGPRVLSSIENGLCRLTKSQWSVLDSLDLCKLPWSLLATLPFSLFQYKYMHLDFRRTRCELQFCCHPGLQRHGLWRLQMNMCINLWRSGPTDVHRRECTNWRSYFKPS